MAIEIRLPLLPSSISLSSVGGVMMIHSSPDAFLRDKSSNPTHASSPFHTQRERERERERERAPQFWAGTKKSENPTKTW